MPGWKPTDAMEKILGTGANVLDFPKSDFSSKQVRTFKHSKLEYPKAWIFESTRTQWRLSFNPRMFEQYYRRDPKTRWM